MSNSCGVNVGACAPESVTNLLGELASIIRETNGVTAAVRGNLLGNANQTDVCCGDPLAKQEKPSGLISAVKSLIREANETRKTIHEISCTL